MPVLLERGTSRRALLGSPGDVAVSDFTASRSISLALVNNMPDAALASTERQFAELLAASSRNLLVRLKLFSLPGVPRGVAARRYLDTCFPIESLWIGRMDGLIVTGAEPRAATLSDEPYWSALSGLVDWAQRSTLSTIWSCLAAHAAVLHTDGIRRRLLPEKRSGIFACTSVPGHPMSAAMPQQFPVPHSRCNDLDERDLSECGYTVLSRSAVAGVDSFVKKTRSMFVFFQGHPEYEKTTLLREYRRDVARFLDGQRQSYPALPESYFSDDAQSSLAAFRERAEAAPGGGMLTAFPDVEAEVSNTWHSASMRVYRNWLTAIANEKQQHSTAAVLPWRSPIRGGDAYRSIAGNNDRTMPVGVAAAPIGPSVKGGPTVVAAPSDRPKV